MAGKFYAVKQGKTPGIYMTWDACKKQVDGYSGAIYKSFKTKGEAEAFIGTGVTAKTNKAMEKNTSIEEKTFIEGNISTEKRIVDITKESNIAIAYVDGSYNVDTKEFSYGMVIFYKGEEFHFSEKVEDKELALMRNVAGEIKGSEAAMRFAIEKGCDKVIIYHDYEGIARWCLGDWKTNKEGTKAYKDYYDSIKNKLEVEFVKVKGHSNDKYNDLADELAKKAIF